MSASKRTLPFSRTSSSARSAASASRPSSAAKTIRTRSVAEIVAHAGQAACAARTASSASAVVAAAARPTTASRCDGSRTAKESAVDRSSPPINSCVSTAVSAIATHALPLTYGAALTRRPRLTVAKRYSPGRSLSGSVPTAARIAGFGFIAVRGLRPGFLPPAVAERGPAASFLGQ